MSFTLPSRQEVQRPLPAYERALSSVRKGMREVIEGGTGGRAAVLFQHRRQIRHGPVGTGTGRQAPGVVRRLYAL